MKSLVQYGNQKTKSSRLPENYLKCSTLQIKQAVSFCVFGQLVGNLGGENYVCLLWTGNHLLDHAC